MHIHLVTNPWRNALLPDTYQHVKKSSKNDLRYPLPVTCATHPVFYPESYGNYKKEMKGVIIYVNS